MRFCGTIDGRQRISRVGFGGASISGYDYGNVEEKDALAAVAAAWDAGVTTFDCADIYGFGRVEELFRGGLGSHRKDAVIVSKFGVRRTANGKIIRDCSVGWLAEALHSSLLRLGLDCLPVYLVHWYDGKTPIEDLMLALERFRAQGKISKIGVSNFEPELLREAKSFSNLDFLQLPYNLVNQGFKQQLQTFSKEGAGLSMVYDVLGRGLLTGKYDKDAVFGGTDTRSQHRYFVGREKEHNLKVVEIVKEIAAEKGVTPANVAMRWVLEQEFLDIALVGCKTSKQAIDNARVFDFIYAEEDKLRLNDVTHCARPESGATDYGVIDDQESS